MTNTPELLFVDPSISDPRTILASLRPEVEGVLLEAGSPAADQIAAVLRGRSGLDAVHIMAHGRSGEVSFGAGAWTADSLDAASDALSAIGAALGERGDVRLWSCETAAGDAGRKFVEALAKATGARVAGATGRVGAEALGGGWTLDARTAQAPLTAAGIAAYAGVLAGATRHFVANPGTYNWSTVGSSTSYWSTTSGGTTGASAPVAGDLVIFDDGTSLRTINIDTTTVALASLSVTQSNYVINVNSGKTLNVNYTTSSGITLTAGTLSVAGGTIITGSASSITLSSGGSNTGSGSTTPVLSGYGTVSSAVAYTGTSGTDSITATGGTLEITGAITNPGAGTLALTVTGASDKLLLDAASAVDTLSFGSTGTLELNTSGTLTLTSALAIGAGTVKLDGTSSALTDTTGISLTTGTITGLGKVTGAISASGAAHITANGGTLEIANAITNSGSLALTVTGASDKLLLDAASAASSASFNSSTGTLELNTGGTLTLSSALAIGAGTVKLDGTSSALTDTTGISLSTGTITGLGKVTGAISASGAAHITANGGTLEIASAITNSGSLALTVTGASDKLLLDASSAATSLSFGSTGTLELNTSGTLTLSSALSIGAGTVKLDAAGSTLTDAAGVSIAGGAISGSGTLGASTNLTGYGTVGVPLSASAVVTASGGTLEMTGSIGAASAFHIANVSGSVLKFDAAVGTTSIHPTITFNASTSGTLDLTNITLANFNGVISGFGTGDSIKVTSAASAWLDSTGKILTVYNSSGTSLGTINLGSTSYVGDDFNVSGGVITESTDSTTPAISSVTFSQNSGDLDAGQTVTITVNTNEAVAVTGAPLLNLNDGGTATYVSGSGTNALTFTYTVAAGQNVASLALASSSAVNLNGGSILDAAAKALTLTGANGAAPTGTLQIDTTPPTAVATVTALSADTGSSSTDFITNTAAQTVSGTYTNTLGGDETIQVSANGGTTWVTATASGGTWSASGVTLTATGTALTVRTIDTAGNTTAGTGHSYTLDTTAPTVSSVAASGTGITSGAGDLNAGHVVTLTVNMSSAVTVAGGTPTLTLNDGGVATYTGGTGTSALTFSYTVAAGDNTADLTVTTFNANGAAITDVAGNPATMTGAATNPSGTLQIDTTAPTVPAISQVTDNVGTIQGVVTSGGVTDDTTPTVRISLTGTGAVAGDSVQLLDNGSALGSSVALVAADITAGYKDVTTSALSNGSTNAFTATVTDAAGNVSPASASYTITIDTSAPTAVATVTALSADTGASSTDFITNTASQTVSGTYTNTLGGDETIQVSANGGTTWVTATASGGTWSASGVTLTATGTALTVRTIDTAGNTTAGTGHSYTLDTTAPTVSSVAASGTGITSGAGDLNAGHVVTLTVNMSSAVTVAGGTPTLTLNDGGVATYTGGTGTSALTFSYTVAAGDNTADLTVSAFNANGAAITDVAGNPATMTGAATNPSGTLQIDTTAPATPSTPDLASSSDTGVSNTDNITNDTTPTLTGTAESGSTVTIYDTNGTTVIGTGVATSGAYAITTSTLSAGVHTFTAMATDAAGNTSAVSSGLSVTIDTTAPNAPSAPDLTAASDTGISSTDNITKLTTPTFTGTAEAGSTVTLYNGSTAVGSTTADGSGNWTITSTTLSSGTKTMTAKATDVAGNTSVASSSLSVTIDTTAPSGSLSTRSVSLVSTSDSGVSNSDKITNVTKPVVQVSTLNGVQMAAGDIIEIIDTSNGNAVVGSYTVQSGDLQFGFEWKGTTENITLSTPLTDGVHTLGVVMGDVAGNTNTASALANDATITIDTTAPTITTVTDSPNSPDLPANSPVTITVNFDGAVTAGTGATITLSNGHTAAYAGGSGTSTLTFTYNGVAGADVSVTAATNLTDVAGNAVSNFGEVICFMPGTLIRTPSGEVAVEALQAGDLVITADGVAAPVRWVGRQTVSMLFADPLRVLPIRILAGALGDNLPVRDLLVSPDHALLVDGVLVHAGALVNGVSILREADVPTSFVYYHVELADHALIMAEGVAAETFIDNVQRLAFDNWAEHEALPPQDRAMVEMAYPRAKSYRQTPRATRERLMARGEALYGTTTEAAA